MEAGQYVGDATAVATAANSKGAMESGGVHLLVVMDDSGNSKRAVGHVARVVEGQPQSEVCLLHVLAPRPPVLFEIGDAQRPGENGNMQEALHHSQRQWLAAAKWKARPALQDARDALHKAGLAAGRVSATFLDPAHPGYMVDEILAQARAHRCQGIVVGRKPTSRLRELIDGDLALELVRRGGGFAVWVVE